MKKFAAFLLMSVFGLGVWAAPFYVRVNGKTNYAATATGQKDFQGRDQYKASKVPLAVGDVVKCFDEGSGSEWAIAVIDPYGAYKNFDCKKTGLECKVAGTYDMYIKLKFNDDMWYVEQVSAPDPDNYYIAGNGQHGSDWCCGVSWKADGCKMDSGRVQYALPAGRYEFKITDGTWNTCWGGESVDAASSTPGWAATADGNVAFQLADSAEVTIQIKNQQIIFVAKGSLQPIHTTSVPAQCHDIILQGFYYDSYEVNPEAENGTDKYGDTRWTTLAGMAGDLGAAFDLIWLPPSSYASGTGYHPKQYSNQNSDWGSRAELQSLIRSLHNVGAKVVADIVINHMEAMSSWCDLSTQNFGEYGKFETDGSWICNTDEMNWPEMKADTLAGECWGTATGNADDGENWESARDWAHDMPKVQEMFKAYLKWMKQEIGYDGWRYDKGDGFNNWHMWNYNTASEPYIAFMECWKGNSDIKSRIDAGKKDIAAFDFQNMYYVFKDGIAKGSFNNCGINGKEDWGDAVGLVQSGYKRNAVTFVDNHDMFLRNDQEFGGKGKSMTPALKTRLLQANAYLLSMPGIPCVFYPHWFVYQKEINDMINARRVAGVHSESVVREEEVSNTGYKATVVGTNGLLIITLGDKTIQSATGTYKWLAENNYQKLASGEGYALWVHNKKAIPARIIATPETNFSDSITGIRVTLQTQGGIGKPSIYYTLDGTDPDTTSALYTDTLTFNQTTTIKAIAVTDSVASQVYAFTYTYRAPLARGIRVRFNKPDEWEKVYFYAWQITVDSAGVQGSTNIMGAYPGQRIYRDAEGWYAYEFDASLDTIHFCISSGDDCGALNVRSNDLTADYDVCYGWTDSLAAVDKYELLLDCDTLLNPEFDLSISPESGDFRSLEEGQKVQITAIGCPNAMIYYTTDGTEPTTGSLSAQDSVSFTIYQTTTVKAYAVKDKNTQTPVYSETYTYKAPQTGPLEVKFFKPHDWQDLYIYAFTRVKVGTKFKDTSYPLDGKTTKWPGIKWTTFNQVGGDSIYYFTMPADIKEIYVIFNIGSNKRQTQDIFLDENACYVWNTDCYRATISPKCDGEMDVEDVWVAPLDETLPMYNVLGMQVDATYQGVIIQGNRKYLKP